MRLALISDQHGNDVAFRAVLGDLERAAADEIICLGDVAQGGAEPAATLDRLRALGCRTVMGNSDALLLEVPADPVEPIPERLLEVREWTLSELDHSHLDFLRSFRPKLSRDYEGFSVLCFHGSPRSYDDILLPESDRASLASFRGYEVDLLAGGHTHKQWARRIDDALFVNPGSVGISTDFFRSNADERFRAVAEYALVTLEEGVSVEFRQVVYAASDVQSAAKASGRPYSEEWARHWANG